MSTPRHNPSTGAFWVYLAISAVALIGTAYFNVKGFTEPSDSIFVAWFANSAVTSLTIDLFTVASAASIFIIVEGRRLGMRWYWLYVVASFVTAVGFTFALFLAMRERRRAAIEIEVQS